MGPTVKEIAAKCGVSEQAIRAWCRRNHVAKDARGSFAISDTTKTLIYQHYKVDMRNEVSQSAKASCETCETSETQLISMLQKELESKNQQLAVKDEQIRDLNARLAEVSTALVAAQQTAQAAQALHAGTIQQLGQGGQNESHTDQPPQEAPQSPQSDEQPQTTQNTTPTPFVAQGATQETPKGFWRKLIKKKQNN